MKQSGDIILYSADQIERRVKQLAKKIAKDYTGKRPVLISILKGSFVLLADLCRELYKNGLTDIEIDFLTVSSYGKGTTYSGSSKVIGGLTLEIKNKDLLIVEDIVDTGHTLIFLQSFLKKRNPRSVRTLAFLDKKKRREVKVPVEYIGFTMSGTEWVEGYGLDGGEYGRGRPDIVEKKTL